MDRDETIRAAMLMRLAASVLRECAADAEVFYDEADCDGSCLADDLEASAESIAALAPAAQGEECACGYDRPDDVCLMHLAAPAPSAGETIILTDEEQRSFGRSKRLEKIYRRVAALAAAPTTGETP